MKVLLLGATGSVGSRLIPALLAHHHQVVAYVRSASKLPSSVTSQLSAVIEGSGTDSAGIKAAILKENCDAVINAAGLAAMTSWHTPSQLSDIFAAVVKAATEAAKERGSAPLRCWFMSGFSALDSPKMPYLLLDYIPIYPEHRTNYNLIQQYSTKSDIAWSLFCANVLTPRHTPPVYPHPSEASANNLVVGANSPPAWGNTLKDIPLVGTFLNILINAPSYGTPLEDCVDFMAADLEKGLDSEWIGKRVGMKVKPKAG